MLTDADRELITAAVDGALDDRREPAFRALVADSAEAAGLFHQLQAHARRLRELRRLPAPLGLADDVRVRVRGLPDIIPSTRRRVVAGRPSWLTYSVAASLFLAVTAGSFWYVGQAGREPEARALRRALPATTGGSETVAAVVPQGTPVEVIAAPRAVTAVAVLPTPLFPEAAPTPRSVASGDVVGGSPAVESAALTTIEVRLPLRATVADLDRADLTARVASELARDPAFRLDLFVHDPLRAAEVFQITAKAAGLDLVVDAAAQDRLKKKLPTSWAVYTEALSAEEIAGFLAQLAARTKAADPTPVFASAHLFPAQAPEQRDLRDLLGVDPGLGKRTKAAVPKSVSSGTIDQVTSALQKTGDKPAIFLSFHPPAARMPAGASKEVKAYLEGRGERKPAAVPLMIVIRPVS